MPISAYAPTLALRRGETLESIHFGAIAVVDSHDQMLTFWGDPDTVTFLRSTAKPFQALPFIEAGGADHFNLSPREIAIICASHSGTDEHYAVLSGIQAKANIQQSDLQCGVHYPSDKPTSDRMLIAGQELTPNRHNCSGKHTGMLAYARMRDWPIEDYLDPQHPLQKEILTTFSQMCKIAPELVALGTDGCSAPNFAIPLRNAALGLARLVDPWGFPQKKAQACRTIIRSMTTHPEMVAGPGKFDTRLMSAAQGKLLSKGGAEGYQGIGIFPGVLAPDSPGIGIAFKISDGDLRSRARPAVALEILRQLGLDAPEVFSSLAELGPRFKIYNWRKLLVGEAYPVFTVNV